MGKYHNKPTEVNGYRMDSRAETRRYEELNLTQLAGEIHGLDVHPTYEIIPAFTDNKGKKHQATFYEGDFVYIEHGTVVVEDVKSVATKTAVFKLKEKLFLMRYREIDFRVVEA